MIFTIYILKYTITCSILFKHNILSNVFSKRIIVSMTTSPKRINEIQPAIDSILNQTIPVDYIMINLPKVFKRDNSKFEKIPKYLTENPKIILNYVEDIGPSTKIVPTCKSDFTNYNDIIISVDDDIWYPPELVHVYLYYHTLYPNCVITGTSLFYKEKYSKNINPSYYYPLKECELLEGFSGVLYKKEFLEDIPLSHFDKNIVPMSYYLSDDLLLSNYIIKKKIKIISLTDTTKLFKNLKPLDYGKQSDALHKGASGTNYTCKIDPITGKSIQDCNRTNYKSAIEWLMSKNDYYLEFSDIDNLY